MRSTEVVAEEEEVVKVAGLANRNVLSQVIFAYLFLPAPPCPNAFIKFRLADTSKPLLSNSPSLLKPRAWADLLARYPENPRIHFLMIL